MKHSTHYQFFLPEAADSADIGDINANFTAVDTELAARKEATDALETEKLSCNEMTLHCAAQNPHAVTAAQTGAYAKAEADATGKKSPGRVASLPVTDPKEGGAASSMQLMAEGSMQPSTATDYNFVKVLDSLRAMSQQTGFSGSQRPAMMDPPSKIRSTTPLKSSVM